MKLSKDLQKRWESEGFSQPTTIQEKMASLIENGDNVLGISPTGTGKTLAYLLPLLPKLEANSTLQLIVLAPSQELAQQIGQVIRQWQTSLKVQVLTGGANLRRQIDNLKKKPEIIVATIGRLMDVMQQSKKIKLHQVKSLIVDEADVLVVDIQVQDLIKRLQRDVQMIAVSATSSSELDAFVKRHRMMVVTVDNQDVDSRVTHGYITTQDRKRTEILRKLAQVDGMRGLVFVANIAKLAVVFEKLQYEGVKVGALTSDSNQIARQKALGQLRNSELTFLLTTDIASRGLDVDDLPVVIHYDLPRENRVYTHRVGRTGRMGKSGLSLALINSHQQKELQKLAENNEVVEYSIKNTRLKQIDVPNRNRK